MIITNYKDDIKNCSEVLFGLTIFSLGWMIFLKMLL